MARFMLTLLEAKLDQTLKAVELLLTASDMVYIPVGSGLLPNSLSAIRMGSVVRLRTYRTTRNPCGSRETYSVPLSLGFRRPLLGI